MNLVIFIRLLLFITSVYFFFLQLIVLYRDGVASSFVDKILASRVYYPKDRTVEVLEMRSPTILILEFGQSKGLFYGNDNNLTHFYF